MIDYSISFVAFMVMTSTCSFAQQNDATQAIRSWDFTFSGNLYLIPDDIYFNPVFTADLGHLHLETRYNYEDFRTGSVFGGYHFSTDGQFEFNATPMLGIVFGNTNGLAPGLLLDMYYRNFNLYAESEYMIDFATESNSFFYTWSEFTFAPDDWIWFGIAAQRTKLYQTKLDIQRGFTLGFSRSFLSVSGYLFNISHDDPYGVLTLDLSF